MPTAPAAASRRRSPIPCGWTRSPPRRPSSRSPSPRCRSPCARCRWRKATIPAISRWSRRAAPARCTPARSRASCISPRSWCRCSPRTSPRSACCSPTSATISSAPSIAISPASISRRCRASIDEMVAEASADLRHAAGAERQIHLDLRYVGQEFTLQVPVSVEQLEAGDRRGIRARVRRALRAPLRPPFAG